MSKQNYNSAVEILEKENYATNSLSMETNNYNQIFKNKFYFIYMIFKLIFLEILFLPIIIKRLFKNFTS